MARIDLIKFRVVVLLGKFVILSFQANRVGR
jgi:hypothetical protein